MIHYYDMVQVGLAESLPRVILLLNLIRYHRVLGMLSELATSLYALTATRDNGLWAPRRRQFLPKALSEVPVQQCGTRPGERILPKPKGQDGELGPGRPRNVQVCFGVIGRRSP